MPTPPLDGLTVLDFSHALAGPYCTLLMAAYGARVIKVESPDGGDMGRAWGPPFQGSDASFFVGLNSGKQSITLDLKSPQDLDICRRLAAKADFVIENFRPGTMKRLGLGYDELAALHPGLIYVSISGYGQSGPRMMEPAMDLIVQASSGLISVTGTAAGETVRCGHSVADVTAGMFALIGALMALESRHRTGRGQFVDVGMLDSLVSAMASNFAAFLGAGITPKPLGTAFATIVPYRGFQCADREIVLAVASEKLWAAFCRAIGREDFGVDERYGSNALRVKHRAILEPQLEAMFRAKPAAHWVETLQRGGVPVALVRNFEEVLGDAHSAERELFPEVEHEQAGRRPQFVHDTFSRVVVKTRRVGPADHFGAVTSFGRRREPLRRRAARTPTRPCGAGRRGRCRACSTTCRRRAGGRRAYTPSRGLPA